MPTIELAKVGKFGQDGTEVTVNDLKEVEETFQSDAPVTLGHTLADWMPRFGTVSKVFFDPVAKILKGDVDLTDAIRDAYDRGFYKKWSVGIRTLKDSGKKYLHHLALLGEVPPKIRDLKILEGSFVNMSDGEKTTVWTFVKDSKKKENINMPGEDDNCPGPYQSWAHPLRP